MSAREKVTPHESDSRYTRRDSKGQFTKNQSDVGRSLAADRRQRAQTVVPKGQGDRGDQKQSRG